MLLDEGVERLVRDEQQEAIDRARRGQVGTGGQLLHPAADVAQEADQVVLPFSVGRRVQVADVVVERELHVHVQLAVPRHEKGEVGDTALHGPLAAVVDVLREPGQAQHVLRHALTPLATSPAVGQRLAQCLGRLGQRGSLFAGLAQPAGQLAELRGPVPLQLLHESADLPDALGHDGELPAHRLANRLARRLAASRQADCHVRRAHQERAEHRRRHRCHRVHRKASRPVRTGSWVPV